MKDKIILKMKCYLGYLNNDKGIGVVEVILILLVLVGLVLIFKNQIVSIANSVFTSITSQIDSL